MATFTWIPDTGATVSHEPRIRSAKFGDGYEQRSQDGINADMEKWPITFSNRLQTEADAIATFLKAQGGVTSFQWVTPEGGSAKTFVCKKWSRSINSYPVQAVTAEFIQVPL